MSDQIAEYVLRFVVYRRSDFGSVVADCTACRWVCGGDSAMVRRAAFAHDAAHNEQL